MSTNGPKGRKSKPQWFGSAITAATSGASGLPKHPFPEKLRAAIELHIEKAVTRRHQALTAIRRAMTESEYDELMKRFLDSDLSKEGHFSFDTAEYPLLEAFKSAIGLPQSCALSSLHQNKDTTKLHLLRHLTQQHEALQTVYDDFVRKICCPKLEELYGDCHLEDIYYQCFPCVRIIQPGEFSIGPHADVVYGHHPFTTNFYVLLTDLTAWESSAALFLESRLGSEDWHPILGKYGEMVKHFPGAICAHWTTDNNTAMTRVSLDFRLIPGPLFHSMANGGKEEGGQLDVYRQKEGYYSQCRRVVDQTNESSTCSNAKWERIGPLRVPDARVGFPWTVSNWDKLLGAK